MESCMHTTQEGIRLPIAAMSDSHLINTIEMFCRPMAELTKKIEQGPLDRTPRERALYGAQEVDPSRYRDSVESFMHRVGDYVFEATIRGLQDRFRPSLIEAMGREGRDEAAGPTAEERALKGTSAGCPRTGPIWTAITSYKKEH